jgi:lipopolysaccharide transport system ATP-binding protein
MTVAIKIENLSKQYRLGLVSTHTLKHDLNRWWTINIRDKEDPYLKIGEVNDRTTKSESEYIWALRDINLEVQQGDVLGIIGKNGAGKSTLLKILSKVTAPTTGTVKVRGRIASLLEVGTGFHMELTGRENIFVNGVILGMSKAETQKKFDEIVDFAGVERFIDTPVKRYSSGMMVRLGFAVAAHLDPEILIVDEVLAVGDAEFQKKALGKMQDISVGKGRTVIFVSHNLASILDLCNRSILISNGSVYTDGSTHEVVAKYLESTDKIDIAKEWRNVDNAPGNDYIKLKRIYTINSSNEKAPFFLTTDKIGIHFEYEILEKTPYFTHGINIFTTTGLHLLSSHDNNKFLSNTELNKGLYSSIVWIPDNLLQQGDYIVSLAAMRYNQFQILFHENDLVRIQVIDPSLDSVKNEECRLDLPGIIRPKLLWGKRILESN